MGRTVSAALGSGLTTHTLRHRAATTAYQRIAERRIREAQGQAVTRGDQGALDFDEEATA